MRVVVVGEKPSIATQVISALPEALPGTAGADILTVFANPFVHLNPMFRYPHNIRWSQYPWVGEPVYKQFAFTSWLKPRYSVPVGHNRYAPLPEIEPYDGNPDPEARALAWVRSADLIVGAMDMESNSVLTFRRLLDYVFPEGEPAGRVIYPLIRSLARVDLLRSLKEAPTAAEADSRYLSYGLNRRRFDYCYGVNALAVLGRTMWAAGIDPKDYVPSKYALQLLYVLRGLPPVDEGHLVQLMSDWKGTGKYAAPERRYSLFGSCASRATIIEQLVASGLADHIPGERHPLVRISDAGNRFLDLMHPDCEDPDLPFRLDAWCVLSREEATRKMDRYFRTFFGKQKRFLSRRSASVQA